MSRFNSNPSGFELVWTSPAPRIGIIARSPATTTLASLYTFLSDVHSNADRELGLRERSFSNFGCHLCLYVSGQSDTNVTCREGEIFTEDGELSGKCEYCWLYSDGRVSVRSMVTSPYQTKMAQHI